MAESARTRSRRKRTDEEPEQSQEPEQNGEDTGQDEPENQEPEQNGEDEGQDEPESQSDTGGDPDTALSAKELIEAARDAVAELTELTPESVTGLEWDADSWLVTVDMLELSRVPNTTDVLASYVVQLDPSGSLLGYQRTRRFVRGQVEGD